MRLQTDSGTWMEIAVAPSTTAKVTETRIDVDPRFRDAGAEAKGRGASFRNAKEPRVKVYRGYHETLVASSQAGFLLSQGFTASPTKEAPPTDFVCGVDTDDGGVCAKRLQSDRHRINHIRTAHADTAPWILSEEDMLKSRGKVLLGGGRISGTNDPRVAVLEAKVNELLKLLNKSAPPEVAQSIAEDLNTELDVIDTGADEFMEEDVEEAPPVYTAASPHTCKPKGRFGRIIDGCPACEFKKSTGYVGTPPNFPPKE